MRHAVVVLLLSLLANPSSAQPRPDTSTTMQTGGIVMGMDGGIVMTRGDLRRTVGSPYGGFHASLGLRMPSGVDVGLHLATSQLEKHTETSTLDSGLDVKLKTTTKLSRIAAYGQYGPRFGRVRPYGGVHLGIHVLRTATKIPDEDNHNREPNDKTQKESVAPAAGVAMGVEIGLPNVLGGRFALRVEGRHTYGGATDYLMYSKGEGSFVERSSETSTSSLNVGFTINH